MTDGAARLEYLPPGAVRPHPKNPRVSLREDVVEAIRVSLAEAGSMSPEYAIRVRPVEGGHEIISGHHRHEAVKRAGLETLPCWVKEMTDDEAYMALVLDNRQGELSPLEIGIHALEVVGKAKAGRGKKGGLAAYARDLGKDQSYLTRLAQAARVAKSMPQGIDLCSLMDKAKHLEAIHTLPESFWPDMVKTTLAKGWSVKDVEAAVAAGKKYLDEPEVGDWPEYLPADRCALAVATGAMTRTDVRRIRDLAIKVRADLFTGMEEVAALARESGEPEPLADLAAEFGDWLAANAGEASWDLKQLRSRRDRYEDLIAEARRNLEAHDTRFSLYCCDLADAPIADGSVDCVVTDPPYPAQFLEVFDKLARFALRVLRPGGSLLVMSGQSHLPEVIARLASAGDGLRYHWCAAYLTPGGQAPQIWPRKVNTFWKPVLWYTKGDYQGDWVGDVVKSEVNDNDKRFHHWGQSESGMADLIDRFSSPGQTVCDPFLGGGTTGVVALAMNRRFVGIDVSADAVEVARSRLLATREAV